MSFISSRYINGWSIHRALRKLGEEAEGWCFFTEEASLLRALTGESPSCRFKPQIPMHLIDDKWAFSEWLSGIGERPLDARRCIDQAHEFPVLLKSRHSWRGSTKLPRGWVCSSEQEIIEHRREITAAGMKVDWFFLQEYLVNAESVSVSGYFDCRAPHRSLFMVTRKVFGSGHELQTGVIVEVISDPAGLVERTQRVLASLNYDGPFELEFIADREIAEFYILELNPRFWMQHGLLDVFSGNGLIKRYLGVEGESDRRERVLGPGRIWIDAIELLQRAVRGDFRVIRLLFRYQRAGAKIMVVPDWHVAISYLLRRAARKMGSRAGLDLF